MSRYATAGLLLATAFGAGPAAAQFPLQSPFAQQGAVGPRFGYAPSPAFSPYLNLLRRGSSPTLNYYGLVRPELQARSAIMGLQQQVNSNTGALNTLSSQATAPGDLGPPDTGHAVYFLNTGSYFLSLNPGANGRNTQSRSNTASRQTSATSRSSAQSPQTTIPRR